MYMCINIQNPHTNLEFHFANEVEKTLHNKLVRCVGQFMVVLLYFEDPPFHHD